MTNFTSSGSFSNITDDTKDPFLMLINFLHEIQRRHKTFVVLLHLCCLQTVV